MSIRVFLLLSVLVYACLSFKQQRPKFGRGLFDWQHRVSKTLESVDLSKFRIFDSGNLDSLMIPQKPSDIEAFKKVNKVFEQSCKSSPGLGKSVYQKNKSE